MKLLKNNQGITDLIEHRINEQGAEPVWHRYRRLSPKILEVTQFKIEKLLDQGIIEPSVSN